MNVTTTVWEFPEPPPLHTDDQVRAIGAPGLPAEATAEPGPANNGAEEGAVMEHWRSVRDLILAMLHFFGAPAALYERASILNKDRRQALEYLRVLESMIRRILLILASEDSRPLEPWLPRKTRAPSKDQTKASAARAPYRGMPPAQLPIRFVLVPRGLAPLSKRAHKPAPQRAFLKEPLPPELDSPQARRRERLLIEDHQRRMQARKRAPVYALVARFEALIRVYKDPLPFVMRLRQRIAAEQGRHGEVVCARILSAPGRLSAHLARILVESFWPACAAVRVIQARGPPFAAS